MAAAITGRNGGRRGALVLDPQLLLICSTQKMNRLPAKPSCQVDERSYIFPDSAAIHLFYYIYQYLQSVR